MVFSDRLSEIVNSQFVDELLDALADTDASSITVDATEAELVADLKATPAPAR